MTTHSIAFCNLSDLIKIFCTGKSRQAIWGQFSTFWKQFDTIIFAELCSKGVDCYHDCPSVSLKLQSIKSLKIKKTYLSI